MGNVAKAPNPAPMFSVRGFASSPFTKACTSSCNTLFFGPLLLTKARLTPSSRANLRTDGLACESLPPLITILSPTGNG